MNKSKIVISVVIPHYNMPAELSKCIDCIHSQTIDHDGIELIVIDNGSSVNIPSSLRGSVDQWLSYKSSANPYICRNMGIKASIGDIILLLDSGTFIAKECMANALIELSKSGAQLLPIDISIDADKNSNYELYYALSHLQHRAGIAERGHFTTAGVFVLREVFDQIGLYNEDSRSGGDIEWSGRARAHDIPLTFSHKVSAKHISKSKSQVLAAEHRFGKGGYLQSKDKRFAFHLKMILYHLLPDKPSRITRRISYQDDPEPFQKRFWTMWWITWRTNLIFLRGYLSAMLSTRK